MAAKPIAAVALLAGIILLAVGGAMAAGVLPQSTTGFQGSVAGGIVVAFTTVTGQTNSSLILFNSVTLTDHSTVASTISNPKFTVNWGDSSPAQAYGFSGFHATHVYPAKSANYTIVETASGTQTITPHMTCIPGSSCPTPLPVTLAAKGSFSSAIVIGNGASSGGSPGCGASCPNLVANASVTTTGLTASLSDHSLVTGMCTGGPPGSIPSAQVGWGDSGLSTIAPGGAVNHTYASAGTYVVSEFLQGSYPAKSGEGFGCAGPVGTLSSNVSYTISVGSSGTTTQDAWTVPPFATHVGLTIVSVSVLIAGVTVFGIAIAVLAGGSAAVVRIAAVLIVGGDLFIVFLGGLL